MGVAPGAEVRWSPVVAVAVEVVELELVVGELLAAVEAAVVVCGEAFGAQSAVALGLPVGAVTGGGVPAHRRAAWRGRSSDTASAEAYVMGATRGRMLVRRGVRLWL